MLADSQGSQWHTIDSECIVVIYKLLRNQYIGYYKAGYYYTAASNMLVDIQRNHSYIMGSNYTVGCGMQPHNQSSLWQIVSLDYTVGHDTLAGTLNSQWRTMR